MVKAMQSWEIFRDSHILLRLHELPWLPFLKFTVISTRQKSFLWVSKRIPSLRLTCLNNLGSVPRHSEMNFDAGKRTLSWSKIWVFSNSQFLLQFYWFSWLSFLKLTVTSKRRKSILWVSKSISGLCLVYWNHYGGYMMHSEMNFEARKCTISFLNFIDHHSCHFWSLLWHIGVTKVSFARYTEDTFLDA